MLAFLLLASATSAARLASSDSMPPYEAVVRFAQARLLESQGDLSGALNGYAGVLAIDPTAGDAARHVSDLAARLGQTQRSLEAARQALQIDPHDARARWLEGSALMALGHNEEGLSSLQQAAREDSDNADYQRTVARAAEQLDRVPLVARAWRAAAELDPDDGETWFQLAAAEARLGRFGAADSALAEARERVPDRPGLLFLDGWIRESTGHPNEAIALYQRHLTVNADDQLTRRRLVNLLAQASRYPEAWREARKVTASKPDDTAALEAEAELAFRANHPDAGHAALQKLQGLSPGDPSLTAQAAGVLGRVGRPREAETLAQRWALAHPKDARGPALRSGVYDAAGKPDSAIAEARRAVAMAPDSLAAHVGLARVLQRHQHYADASAAWRKALLRFPGQPRMGLDLALCLEQGGDVEGAVAAARDVLKQLPDDATALNFLGYLFADHNRDLPEAEHMIRRAVDQEPDNGAYVDSMGWVEYRLGRLVDARRLLEQAVQLTRGDATVREHLGDVYRSLNLPGMARDQYRLAVAADSTNVRLRNKLAEVH